MTHTMGLVIIVMGLDYLESRGGDGQGLFVRWWGGDGILEAMGAPWGGGWADGFWNSGILETAVFWKQGRMFKDFQNGILEGGVPS